MTEDRLAQAHRDAREEATPIVALAVAAYLVLAGLSWWHGWQLLGHDDWWIWVVIAIPAVALWAVFLLGFDRLGLKRTPKRRAAVGLLELVALANFTGVALVFVALVGGSGSPTGGQLLASAAVVLLVNVITFGLIFWEVDGGGPVRRAMADKRDAPDFQFPQDENPGLASPGWAPALNDYLYIALTNSIAFSPTDAMPMTHRAKAFMGVEALIAAVTVLTVAARAVNILN